MENYPSNSKTVKPEPVVEKATPEKKIERITVGAVTRRKKPLGKRFAEIFGAGDAQGVLVYIATDVLLPAAKDMMSDAVSQGVDKMLFGEVRSRPRSSASSRPGTSSGYVSYNNRYAVNPGNRRDRTEPPAQTRRAKTAQAFDELVLETRAEADEVLTMLFSCIEEYGQVTVSDLYDMLGMSADFTDEKWGWEDMRGSTITRVKGGGYLLDLPRPKTLD